MLKIVSLEDHFELLKRNIKPDGREKSALILCHQSPGDNIQKLLPCEVIIPREKDYISRSSGHYSMAREFTNKIYRKAIDKQLHVIRVHSHPPGLLHFSGIDERTEREFARELFSKVDGMIYASMVFSSDLKRIDSWFYDERNDAFTRTDKIIVIGKKGMRFYFPEDNNYSLNERENRDYLAFGENGMKVFKKLDVGIVGCGGTGGIVAEHLTRLCVRRIVLCDEDIIEESNLNRLQGASDKDIGKHKVHFYHDYLKYINPYVDIVPLDNNFYNEDIQKIFSGLDVIFGCSDSEVRLSINNLAMVNLIPYFDFGAGIFIENQNINYVGGQIYDVIPGNHLCLNCATNIKELFHQYLKKEDQKREKRQGYINAPIKNPNVYFLNTTMVGFGMWEFLKYVLNLNNKYYFKLYYDGTKNSLIPSIANSDGCIVCRDYLGKGSKAPLLIPRDYIKQIKTEIPEISD